MRSRHACLDWGQIQDTLSCGKVMVFIFCRLTTTSQFLTRAFCRFRFGTALAICRVWTCVKRRKRNCSRRLPQDLGTTTQPSRKELRRQSFNFILEKLLSSRLLLEVLS